MEHPIVAKVKTQTSRVASMAPIDPSFYESNLFPISLFSTYAVTVACLISLIAYSLYNAYDYMPTALRTRRLAHNRTKNMMIMGGVAAVCVGLNSYSIIEALVESYSIWILKAEGALPSTSIWHSTTWYPDSHDVGPLRLGRWMQDVDWIAELSFALGGRARDYFYAAQLSSATLIWSVFLAIEGRRRNIQFTPAYLLLAHLLGLSTASSLFAIALLLTPVSRSALTTSGRQLWSPNWALLTAPVLAGLACTTMFPYFDSNFAHIILGSLPPILTFVPLLVMHTDLIPITWGKKYTSLAEAHASYGPIFRVSSLASLLLHLSVTSAALVFNTPAAYSSAGKATDYDPIWTTHDRVALPATIRLSTAVSKILGAVSDNPVVRKVGWDVLLSAATFCIWSALRRSDVHDMLASSGCPGFRFREAHDSHPLTAAAAKLAKSAGLTEVHPSSSSSSSPSKTPLSPSKRGRGRPRKNEAATTINDFELSDDEPHDGEFVPTAKGRVPEVEHELEQVGGNGGGDTEIVAEEAESAALAWGMCIFGGLGVAAAGVWGAEVVGR